MTDTTEMQFEGKNGPRVTVRLTAEERNVLELAAAANGQTLSELVRAIVDDSLLRGRQEQSPVVERAST